MKISRCVSLHIRTKYALEGWLKMSINKTKIAALQSCQLCSTDTCLYSFASYKAVVTHCTLKHTAHHLANMHKISSINLKERQHTCHYA